MRLSFLLASATVAAVLVALCSSGCDSKQEKAYTLEDLKKGYRQVQLRFRVDPDFEGLVFVKEDPDLPLDFERTYDVVVSNGVVLMPSGFNTGEQPVFHRVIEVVDARTGKVLSSGEDANSPPIGVLGVQRLVYLGGPNVRDGYYFVIGDGTPDISGLITRFEKRRPKVADK